MYYFIFVDGEYLRSFGEAKTEIGIRIGDEEYAKLKSAVANKPTAPSGYTYKLRADTLEWELVELPPEPEPEPTVEDKAEAYDILMGVSE